MELVKISKDKLAWLVVGFMLGIMALGLFILLSRQTRPAAIYITPAREAPPAVPTDTPGPLTIFINGQVSSPGVIDLPQGSILQDALEAAGGYTSQAKQDVVNLALPLANGMHIYVPATNEEGTVPIVTNDTAKTNPENKKVNINNAAEEELDTLPGIGPATARKIIEYRQANGSFSNLEALMNVSGIGPSKFEQIQALISLD